MRTECLSHAVPRPRPGLRPVTLRQDDRSMPKVGWIPAPAAGSLWSLVCATASVCRELAEAAPRAERRPHAATGRLADFLPGLSVAYQHHARRCGAAQSDALRCGTVRYDEVRAYSCPTLDFTSLRQPRKTFRDLTDVTDGVSVWGLVCESSVRGNHCALPAIKRRSYARERVINDAPAMSRVTHNAKLCCGLGQYGYYGKLLLI
ncbi:unnamed protein product [Chrysodeixis includens]|uniref:Uncharacterized protein n=1 Tax=Chrysodeixis includens TaxID=689277 RepID=A0A9N8KZB9_CHRIL|nr:unnamed protein product [Chrysodeixis includens]